MIKESINDYLKEKHILNILSDSTVHARKYELFRFAKFCNENGIDVPSKLNTSIIIDYISYLKVFKKIKKFTQSTIMSILKAYFEYLFVKDIISQNFAATLEKPKFVYPDADYLEFEEVKKIFWFESEMATNKTVARNLLLINMFFTLCLRASEVVNLKMQDIKIELKQIWIERKGGIIVKFPINDEIIDHLVDWFRTRELYQGSNSDWVFLSTRGNQLTARQARSIVSTAMKRAGIIKRKNGTHILRHSGATHRLKNGENIKIIQDMLGHKAMASTEKYLHYSEKDIKEMIDRSKKLS